MKNLQMQLGMRLDRILITCEALGLHHVQATATSSSHILIGLTSLKCVFARILFNRESDCPCFFVGDSEQAFGTCPACAGRRRPRTYT